jgi:hypothetical protein
LPVIDDEMRDEYDFSRATRGNSDRQLMKQRVTIETVSGSDRTVQIKTVEVTAIVNPARTVTFKLPPEIPPGEHRMTVLLQVESLADPEPVDNAVGKVLRSELGC